MGYSSSILYKEHYLTRFNHQKKHYSRGAGAFGVVPVYEGASPDVCWFLSHTHVQ